MQNPRSAKQSFGDAFKAARSAGKKTFTWNGKSYTTETKEDQAKRTAPKAPKRPASPPRNPASPGRQEEQRMRVARENDMRKDAAARNRAVSPYRRTAR